MTELTVTIKTDEATYKRKYLLYDSYEMDGADPIVAQCLLEALNGLKCETEEIQDIKIRSLLIIK